MVVMMILGGGSSTRNPVTIEADHMKANNGWKPPNEPPASEKEERENLGFGVVEAKGGGSPVGNHYHGGPLVVGIDRPWWWSLTESPSWAEGRSWWISGACREGKWGGYCLFF